MPRDRLGLNRAVVEQPCDHPAPNGQARESLESRRAPPTVGGCPGGQTRRLDTPALVKTEGAAGAPFRFSLRVSRRLRHPVKAL